MSTARPFCGKNSALAGDWDAAHTARNDAKQVPPTCAGRCWLRERWWALGWEAFIVNTVEYRDRVIGRFLHCMPTPTDDVHTRA